MINENQTDFECQSQLHPTQGVFGAVCSIKKALREIAVPQESEMLAVVYAARVPNPMTYSSRADMIFRASQRLTRIKFFK